MRAIIILFLLLNAVEAVAEDHVLRAFEHSNGYIVFEVVSEEHLAELQGLERRSQREGRMLVISQGDRWYFGKKDGAEFTRLTPFPQFFTVGGDKAEIN